MDDENTILKLLEKQKNFVRIIGIYGITNNELTDPTNPDCDVVIVLRFCGGKVAYSIEKNLFFKIDESDNLSDIVLGDDDSTRIKSKIKEYINSDSIEINKDDIYGFDKINIPLIRHQYPFSVQPLSTPIGIPQILHNKGTDE